MSRGVQVLLDEEGPNGQFNRAQRAILNTSEFALPFFASFVAVLYITPFPAFVGALIWLAGRAIYLPLYARGAEGRGAGFGIAQHIATPLVGGLAEVALWHALFSH